MTVRGSARRGLGRGAALVALAGALAPHGCESECIATYEALSCCGEWLPGSDMAHGSWGLEGEERLRFGTLMQGAGDLSVQTANAVVELGAACESLALALGEPPLALPEELAASPDGRTRAACSAAARGVSALRAQGVAITILGAHCAVSPAIQLPCEEACLMDPACAAVPGDLTERCPAGSLVTACRGTCTNDPVEYGAGCCKGTCEGSVATPAPSRGVCEGECDGTCEGTCDFLDEAGRCRGRCEGICDGRCAGPSQVDGAEGSFCGGVCVGECSSEDATASCRAELARRTGDCEGPPACMAGCRASAAALAQCPPATLKIDAGAVADGVAASRLGALRSLLPPILTTARARVALLRINAEALVPSVASAPVLEDVRPLLDIPEQCKTLASRSLMDALDDAATLEAAAGEVLAASGG